MKSTSRWKRLSATALVAVTRNDLLLFGALRKVFVCKAAGSTLACAETAAP